VSAPSLAMSMIAKLSVFWVFSFATLHLLYNSGYYLSMLTRYSTSFVEVRFQRFQSSSVPRKHEERVDRGFEKFARLLPLGGRTRCCSRACVGGTPACRGCPSYRRKSDGVKKKAPVLTQTLHATGEFPGSLHMVKSYPTRGKSMSRKGTRVTFGQWEAAPTLVILRMMPVRDVAKVAIIHKTI